MLRWPADPVVRLHLVRSLRNDVMPVATAMAILFASQLIPFFQSIFWPTAVGFVAMVGMTGAIPGAIEKIIAMDDDSRLDHLRLSGRTPGHLLVSSIVARSAPVLVLSAIVFLTWRASTRFTADVVVLAVALVCGSIALSLVALTLARMAAGRGTGQAALGAGFPILLGAGLVLQDDSPVKEFMARDLHYAMPLSTMAGALLILAIAIPVAAIACRPACRVIARPSAGRARSAAPLRLRRYVAREPVLYGSIVKTAVASAVAAAVTLGTLGLMWMTAPGFWRVRPNAVGPVVLLPLLAGAFVISLAAREDRNSGRLDALRIAPTSGVRMVAALTVGHWLLFAAAAVAAHVAAVALLGSSPAGLAVTLLVLMATAPLSLMEGWSGIVPLSCTAPCAIVLTVMTSRSFEAGWSAPALLRVALLAWLPFFCTIRIWRQPQRLPLAGGAGWLAVACVTLVAMWPGVSLWPDNDPPTGIEFLSIALLVTIGYFYAPGSPAADWWRPVVTAATMTAVMVWMARRDAVESALAALGPAFAWWIGTRAHQWLGGLRVQDRFGFSVSGSAALRFWLAIIIAFFSDTVVIERSSVIALDWLRPEIGRVAAFVIALFAAALLMECTYGARHRIPAFLVRGR